MSYGLETISTSILQNTRNILTSMAAATNKATYKTTTLPGTLVSQIGINFRLKID